MSTTKTRKPRLRHLLDGFPPDTRVVACGVTWDDSQPRPGRRGRHLTAQDRPAGNLRRAASSRSSGAVRNKAVSIEQLGPDGTYVAVPRSRFLPVRPEDVTRWVFNEDSTDLVIWEERLPNGFELSQVHG